MRIQEAKNLPYGSYRCGSECGSGTLGPRLGGVGSYCGGPVREYLWTQAWWFRAVGRSTQRRTCRPRLDGVELDCGCGPGQGVPVDQGLMGWSLTVAVYRCREYMWTKAWWCGAWLWLWAGPRRTCGPRLDGVELDCGCGPGQGVQTVVFHKKGRRGGRRRGSTNRMNHCHSARHLQFFST